MISQTGTKAASRKTFRIMFCALAIFWSTFAVVAQTTGSGGRWPGYDRVKQEFDDLKPTLSEQNLSQAQLTELAGQLSRMRLLVDTHLENYKKEPGRLEELVLRLQYLSNNIKAEQAKLSRRQPVNPPDPTEAIRLAFFKDKQQTYAPNEDVEVQVFISKRGSNLSPDEQRQMMFAKWIGLMRSSEPHRNIPYYSSPIRQYQGQAAHAAPSIVTFTAPNEGGLYEIRLFDRESGTELASLQFKVANVTKTVLITPKRHHIGNGSCSSDPNCPVYPPSEGPIYRVEFVIPDDRVLEPTITIDELHGHAERLSPVLILINQRKAGEIRNGRNLSVRIPVELLNLQGRKNTIQIVAPKDNRGDVDDLEFRGVRLHYRTSGGR